MIEVVADGAVGYVRSVTNSCFWSAGLSGVVFSQHVKFDDACEFCRDVYLLCLSWYGRSISVYSSETLVSVAAHMWVAVNLRIWPNNLYFVGNEVYEWAVVISFCTWAWRYLSIFEGIQHRLVCSTSSCIMAISFAPVWVSTVRNRYMYQAHWTSVVNNRLPLSYVSSCCAPGTCVGCFAAHVLCTWLNIHFNHGDTFQPICQHCCWSCNTQKQSNILLHFSCSAMCLQLSLQ